MTGGPDGPEMTAGPDGPEMTAGPDGPETTAGPDGPEMTAGPDGPENGAPAAWRARIIGKVSLACASGKSSLTVAVNHLGKITSERSRRSISVADTVVVSDTTRLPYRPWRVQPTGELARVKDWPDRFWRFPQGLAAGELNDSRKWLGGSAFRAEHPTPIRSAHARRGERQINSSIVLGDVAQ